jgi:hypothetical protein
MLHIRAARKKPAINKLAIAVITRMLICHTKVIVTMREKLDLKHTGV